MAGEVSDGYRNWHVGKKTICRAMGAQCWARVQQPCMCSSQRKAYTLLSALAFPAALPVSPVISNSFRPTSGPRAREGQAGRKGWVWAVQIIQSFRLEGTLKIKQFQAPAVGSTANHQFRLPKDLNQSGLERLQGCPCTTKRPLPLAPAAVQSIWSHWAEEIALLPAMWPCEGEGAIQIPPLATQYPQGCSPKIRPHF